MKSMTMSNPTVNLTVETEPCFTTDFNLLQPVHATPVRKGVRTAQPNTDNDVARGMQSSPVALM